MTTWRTFTSIRMDRALEWAKGRPADDPLAQFVRRFPYKKPGAVQLDRPLPDDAERVLRQEGILPDGAALETYVLHERCWAQVTAPMTEKRLLEFEERALVADLRHAVLRLRDSKKRVQRLLETRPACDLAVRWTAGDCFARIDAVVSEVEKIIDE